VPGPARDMRGNNNAKKNIKGMIAPELRELCKPLMRDGKADNEAHAFRILAEMGLAATKNQKGTTHETVAAALARLSPGAPKSITVTAAMCDEIEKFRRENGEFVDGLAGAFKHLVWIGAHAQSASK
jgi:hypothetical protein